MKNPSLNFLLFLSILSNSLYAQIETFPLWEGEVPNSIENSNYEEIKIYEDSVLVKVQQVKIPTLTVYKPESPNGTAIVIFPGGGYQHLSMNKEGSKVAEWLNTLGITAIVVKYRLPSEAIMKDKSIGPLQDAQEAVRFVRRNASHWNLKADKIGVMGFSAGGHLAASLSTLYKEDIYSHENISAKPDFSILVYPVISMDNKIAHSGSKTNLLGESPSKDMVEHYSAEKQVDSLTPPTFLVHATNDKSVPDQNSVDYFQALNAHNVKCEIHLYATGGHGFGLGRDHTTKQWTKKCEEWLKTNHFIN